MQFMPATAARYGLQNPYDPQASIGAAARYLRDLSRKFDGRVDLVLAAYNAGEGAVESFQTGKPLILATGKIINPRRLITGGIPPYRETQEYVRRGTALLITHSLSGTTRFTSSDQWKDPLPRANISDQKGLKSPSMRRPPASLFIEVQ